MQSHKSNIPKERKGINTRILKSALDIPEILCKDLPHIEAEGNREISVDGCKGILEYTQEKIKINAGKLIIVFTGEEMEIKTYSEIQTVISGNILGIEFET